MVELEFNHQLMGQQLSVLGVVVEEAIALLEQAVTVVVVMVQLELLKMVLLIQAVEAVVVFLIILLVTEDLVL